VAVTATFKTVGLLLVELNMLEPLPIFSSVNQVGRFTRTARGRLRSIDPTFLDEICELIEEVRGVVWPGRRFWMILHAEDWQRLVPHSLHGAVVEICVRDWHTGRTPVSV